MFKPLSELNIKTKKLHHLSLLPGFNYTNNEIIKSNILEFNKVIDDKMFTNFFSLIDVSNKKLTLKNRKTNKRNKSKKK